LIFRTKENEEMKEKEAHKERGKGRGYLLGREGKNNKLELIYM
tara:strand:+ start:648 stop:776 length:129 start_codon:yes stop_codon:yes gene_type:complete